MRKTIGIFFLALGCGWGASAQNETDALRFSSSDILGSARYTSLGGAFTALGGDATASLHNPAGLAVFRNNEFSISPSFHQNITNSSYYGQNTFSGKQNLSIGSFQIVGVQNLKKVGNWRNSAISFGVNRTQSFHEEMTISGQNVSSSILDDYTNTVNDEGIFYDDIYTHHPFDIYLAWYQLLIDTLPGESSVYGNASGSLPVDQTYVVRRTGAKRETFLNVAGNYNDKLYLGAGVSIVNVNYSNTATYSEFVDQSDTTTSLDEFSQTLYEDISGRGFVVNVGAIYRPTNALRLGLSLRTPEWIDMKTEFETENVTIYNGDAESILSPFIGEYRFRVNSPAKATIGAAYIYKKAGLISVEADVVDYRSIHMRGLTDSDPFTTENSAIESYLRPVVNIRSGVEVRITQFVSARGGAAFYGNPYTSAISNNSGFQVYSLGLGYRDDRYFVDGSYQLKLSSDQFYIYDSSLVDQATVNATDHRITCTVGVRF